MHTGPNILKENLILYLDAANSKSFPGEPTTNIAKNVFYENRAYNQLYEPADWGGNTGDVYYYSEGGYNNLPFKKQINLTTGSGGVFMNYDHEYFTIQNNTTYTVSVWMKSQNTFSVFGIGSYSFTLNRSSDNRYIVMGNAPSLTSEWQRIHWTFTSAADDYGTDWGVRSILYENYFLPFEVHWCGAQIEQKDHLTVFTSGSRGGEVYDLSGNLNHGTLSTTAEFNNDKFGKVIFSGSEGLTLPISCYPLNQNVSVECVLKRTSDATVKWLSSGLFYRGDWATDGLFFMRYVSGSGDYGDSGWTRWAAIRADFSVNQLVHLIYTHDVISGDWNAYINGKLHKTINISPSEYGYLTEDEILANYDVGSDGGTNGYMDLYLYKHYNKVLSFNEIEQNFEAVKRRFNL